jgi:site-specific DNA-adenine methylase
MTYKGGKAGAGVYQQIINQIPPHEVYIEPFLGGGAVLLAKKRAAASIAIDCDGDVVSRFEGIANSGGIAGVTFICGDAISYLQNQRYERSTFVYCDPPYLFDVRSSKRRIYTHEFGDVDQHEKLLAVLKSLPLPASRGQAGCMVAVSGYWSSLYESSLPATDGWRSISFNAKTRAGVAREWLWMNYPEPVELHDYSYLGQNFREREKITRQKKRWRARLLRMDKLQRYALLLSIAELNG